MNNESSERRFQAIHQVITVRERHWVGDGFYVSTVFSPHRLNPQMLSPFILMDYGAPRHFPPTTERRGVGEHPHRGFETVTFAYQGEVDHRDSYGGGGTIQAGDVQWMTAASGVVHEEFHSEEFSRRGGLFEMVQLWVNLPGSLKLSAPRYQALKGASFPQIRLGGATARLIAGSLGGKKGPALTHTPITMFDMDCSDSTTADFELPLGTTTLIFVLSGEAVAQEARTLRAGDLMIMDRDEHGRVQLKAEAGTRVLVLNGQPLNEPVVAHGPFVMNSRQEIVQAIQDYQAGKMGTLAPTL